MNRNRVDLFLISFLVLFFELACIRWFPAHILYLTFFTNMVLLASFLGMSTGCLIASHERNYLAWTPVVLIVLFALGIAVEGVRDNLVKVVDVGNQTSPQFVFFGTEQITGDVSKFIIPIEVLCGIFFILIALVFIGPGQEVGRSFRLISSRIEAYTINIIGSIVGIVFFALSSWMALRPFWWFLVSMLIVAYFLHSKNLVRAGWVKKAFLIILIIVLPLLSSVRSGRSYLDDGRLKYEIIWSPYYRIDYRALIKDISVNLIGHQRMFDTHGWEHLMYSYAFPHMLNRDIGRPPYRDVLIIGAGSGNDVSRALQWGAEHVDAVEIDPVILDLGRRDHPNRPYDDPRVTMHPDDGRNFLRQTEKKYDLVIYALVDSLVLHSSYSNIRLESFLFTQEAFSDVKRVLKPEGQFVIYNFFRQGWIVARIKKTISTVFGRDPLIFSFPYLEKIEPKSLEGGFTMIMAGDITQLENAFAKQGEYLFSLDQPPAPDGANGFELAGKKNLDFPTSAIKMSEVVMPGELRIADDNWPFLYLRAPTIPGISLRGMFVMAVLAIGFILFMGRGSFSTRNFAISPKMFFLGAGFMLIETKAVVNMAVLFGGTWMVNSVVFLFVLVMILLANIFVLKLNPGRLWPFYLVLIAALVLNCVIPLDYFLGMKRVPQILCASALVFTPILFAGVIFAKSFSVSENPDLDFGVNVAGAMVGGLSEYFSMLLGFQYLMIVAMVFYVLSFVFDRRVSFVKS